MQIKRVEVYKADLPLKRPFRIALGEVSVARNLFIRIDTNEGISGWGEASPFTQIVGETQATCFGTARDLARLLIGKDPLDIENRVREMATFLPHNSTVRSAFDMALYDLAGKVAGLPLYALLGGGNRPIFTDNTVGIDSPESMVEYALKIRDRGFSAVKVKVGTTPEQDIQHILRIREALGPDVLIRIDANQGWTTDEAIAILTEMEKLGIQYCEQPVAAWDIESMRKVHQRTRIPIMADESVFDEHDAFRLAATKACDYLNIKLSKSAGIHVALKINAVAESAGLHCMVGCMNETRLGLTAGAHLVSARPNIQFADLDSALMLTVDPVLGGMVYGAGGEITIPDSPGLGAEIDPAFLDKLESLSIT